MELTQIIANNISRLLEKGGFTQAELSSYLDISRQTLSNYLKGTSTIDSVRLYKTACFFNIPVNELLEVPKIQRTPMLFRAAFKPHDPIDQVENKVFEYIANFETIIAQAGGSSHFTPEQHDLYIEHKGTRISVNNALPRFPASKYKMDDILTNEIISIADSQRKLLGLNDSGAIELISALTQRGINVIFMRFSVPELFGVSVCDSTYGCYIFVNSDPEITIERQLFTVAHEYAHLILHRPLFSSENQASMSSLYVSLLDKMADTFAGRLLCPPSLLYPLAQGFSMTDSTLKSIFLPAIRLKHKLNVSFQSLLYSLQSYGMINRSVVSEYYNRIDRTIEPFPLKDIPSLYELFMVKKSEHIIEVLRRAYNNNAILSKEKLACFLDCSLENAETVFNDFQKENEQINVFI